MTTTFSLDKVKHRLLQGPIIFFLSAWNVSCCSISKKKLKYVILKVLSKLQDCTLMSCPFRGLCIELEQLKDETTCRWQHQSHPYIITLHTRTCSVFTALSQGHIFVWDTLIVSTHSFCRDISLCTLTKAVPPVPATVVCNRLCPRIYARLCLFNSIWEK